MNIAGWIAAVGAGAVLLLSGCGSEDSPETTVTKATTSAAEPAKKPATKPAKELRDVWVTLDGKAGAENLGILMAQERGYFEEVGLAVEVGAPAFPSRPIGYVASESADIGVSQLPQVVLAQEKGARVVAVGKLLSRPTVAMIWLPESGIGGIEDLKGKTIAVSGLPFQEGFLRVLLARAGLRMADVEVKNAGYNLVPALVNDRADAILGSWNLDGPVLEAQGLKPVITPLRRLGVPSYDELVVIARNRRLSQDPRFIRDFTSAVARGTAAALEDPEGATRVAEEHLERHPFLSSKAIAAQVKATLPLLSRSSYLSPSRAEGLVDWMYEEGLIESKVPTAALLANASR